MAQFLNIFYAVILLCSFPDDYLTSELQSMCPEVPECYCYPSSDDVRADCTETTLTFIPEGLPANTTQIVITRSLIEVLLSGNLSIYSSLDYLNLQVNNMVELEVNAFSGVPLIEDLYLYTNLLKEIHPGTFQNLGQLRRVFLNDNRLESIPPFGEVTTLMFVNLESNNITSIPTNAFGSNTALTTVMLSNNKISTISANAFSNLNNLENLYLDGNKMQALGVGAFNGLSGLIELSLMNNEIAILTADSLEGTGQSLEQLSLASNSISSVDAAAFEGLVKLQGLQISYNMLTSVPSAAIKPIKTLQEIDLTANLIEKIEDYAFSGIPDLSVINLGFMNTLVEISPNAFNGTTNLTQLSIFGNKKLTNFDSELFPDEDHKSLLIFKLYNNGFTYLDEELFSGKDSLEKVDIFDNPFHCDCRLKWMPRVVAEGVRWASHWPDEIPILCETPSHLQTFEIPRMLDKDFTCVEPAVEISTPQVVVAYLNGNATLQTFAHNGIPKTWWKAPSGEVYIPLRWVPPAKMISEEISVTEHFQQKYDETIVVATLEFASVTPADAGIYHMWASNHLGNVSVTIELEVLPYELTPSPLPDTSPVSSASVVSDNMLSFVAVMTVIYLHLRKCD